ncbi:MAG: hypothetical protein WC959_09455 [Kiritimatiellales bacterium]
MLITVNGESHEHSGNGSITALLGELLQHEHPIKTMPAKRRAEAKLRIKRMRMLQKSHSE